VEVVVAVVGYGGDEDDETPRKQGNQMHVVYSKDGFAVVPIR